MKSRTRRMKQVATYWPPVGIGPDAQATFGAPEPVACRWEDRQELKTDADGNEFVSRATVFVERPLLRQGYLMLGESVATNPRELPGAARIKIAGSIPNLRQTQVLNQVWL